MALPLTTTTIIQQGIYDNDIAKVEPHLTATLLTRSPLYDSH
jgi:hypothetical protein